MTMAASSLSSVPKGFSSSRLASLLASFLATARRSLSPVEPERKNLRHILDLPHQQVEAGPVIVRLEKLLAVERPQGGQSAQLPSRDRGIVRKREAGPQPPFAELTGQVEG